MSPATIVVLNGVAGAGKTSISRALQARADRPFLNAGIDTFLGMLPERYLERPLWEDVLGRFDRPGPVGQALVSGMHHAVAKLSRAGNAVVVDHVLLEPAWWAECGRLYRDLPAYVIGVHCPLDVLLRRERERADRVATVGEAELQFPIVHADAVYDLELDTSTLTPEQCAEQILRRIESGHPPSAFRELAAR